MLFFGVLSKSSAFRGLYESMRGAFRPGQNDNDTATIFDRAAGRVCRSCVLQDTVPAEAHDAQVDCVVTEQGVIRCK